MTEPTPTPEPREPGFEERSFEERAFFERLRKFYRAEPPDSAFAYDLERRLAYKAANRRGTGAVASGAVLRYLGYSLALAAMALLLVWSIPRLAGPVAGLGFSGTATPGPLTLAGPAWELVSLYGQPPLPGTALTLEGSGGALNGSTGCGPYTAEYQATEEGRLSVGAITYGEETCPSAETSEQEYRFLEALSAAVSYTIEGPTLTLLDQSAGPLLVFYTPTGWSPTPVPIQSLVGTHWLLTHYRGQQPFEGVRVTLEIQADQVQGFSGCNYYGGYYTPGPGPQELQMGLMELTLQGCTEPEGVNDWETEYTEALRQVTAYAFTPEGLRLMDASGETILVYASLDQPTADPETLAGTFWALVSTDGSAPPPGASVTLRFDADRLFGFSGCNDFKAEYLASGSEGEMQMSPIESSLRDCPVPEGIRDWENSYLQLLDAVTAFRIAGGTLEMLNAEGQVLLVYNRFVQPPLDPAALVGTRWELTQWDGEGLASMYTLEFLSETDITGSAGCRRYNGRLEMEGGRPRVTYLEMLGDVCPEPVGAEANAQEGRFTTALENLDNWALYSYRIQDRELSMLRLFTVQGPVLSFNQAAGDAREGTPTPTPWVGYPNPPGFDITPTPGPWPTGTPYALPSGEAPPLPEGYAVTRRAELTSPDGLWRAESVLAQPADPGSASYADRVTVARVDGSITYLLEVSQGEMQPIGFTYPDHFAFSPDSRYLYYWGHGAGDGCDLFGFDLYLYQVDLADGSMQGISPYDPGPAGLLAFSPAGDTLAYLPRWNPMAIYIQSMPGGDVRELPSPAGPKAESGALSWSPDGQRLAFLVVEDVCAGLPERKTILVMVYVPQGVVQILTVTSQEVDPNLKWVDATTLEVLEGGQPFRYDVSGVPGPSLDPTATPIP